MAPRLELYCATSAYLLSFDEWRAGTRFKALLQELKARGYAGVETNVIHMLLMGRDEFAAALTAANMRWIAKVYSSGSNCPGNHGIVSSDSGIVHEREGPDAAQHLRVWTAQLNELKYASLRPLIVQVSSQSGRDYFNPADAAVFFTGALAAAAEVDVTVHHETHRGRLLYNPWDCLSAVRTWPTLTLLGDLSHYAVVCEAACEDAELSASIAALAPRIRHIHARVGFEEGPQVPDPRAPKWRPYLDGHMRWWQQVWAAAAARGDEVVTVTPEFLPSAFGYGWCDAYTNEPITDIIGINHWMAAHVVTRYAELYGSDAAPTVHEVS